MKKKGIMMKSVFMTLFSISAVLMILNCDRSQTTQLDSNDTETILNNLVGMDSELTLDALSDEEIANEIFMDGESDELGRLNVTENFDLPIRWGRFVHNIQGTVQFEPYETGADTIYALIERIITGDLVIVNGDTTTTDSGFVFMPTDTLSKPFEMFSTRRVMFARVFGFDDSFHGWRIRGKSPVFIRSDPSNVDITSITLLRQDINSEWQSSFTFVNSDSALSYLITNHNIPRFINHQRVKALLQVENTNPDEDLYPDSGEGAFLHYGQFHHLKGRHPMFDDGGLVDYHGNSSGDAYENDNEFTRIIRVRRQIGASDRNIYKMYFDVIDYETLLNPDGEYHSTVIGIPYIIMN